MAKTFCCLAENRTDRPDETYLLGTFDSKTWFLWPLMIGNESLFEIAEKALRMLWGTPAKIRSFFSDPHLAYIRHAYA